MLPCHKINLQTGKSILHQFEGLHKLWDTPNNTAVFLSGSGIVSYGMETTLSYISYLFPCLQFLQHLFSSSLPVTVLSFLKNREYNFNCIFRHFKARLFQAFSIEMFYPANPCTKYFDKPQSIKYICFCRQTSKLLSVTPRPTFCESARLRLLLEMRLSVFFLSAPCISSYW